MCTFLYLCHNGCDHAKRTRRTTCLANFQNKGKPSCNRPDEGIDNQIVINIPGLCPQCHQDQEISKQNRKYQRATKARDEAAKRLYEFLGQDDPVTTGSYDEEIDENGTTIFRTFINGNKVQEERLDEEYAKSLVSQISSGRFNVLWTFAVEKYFQNSLRVDQEWCPPEQSSSMEGIQHTYQNFLTCCSQVHKVNAEVKPVYARISAEQLRSEAYFKERNPTDHPASTRVDLPYNQSYSPRETANFAKPKSSLRHELKVDEVDTIMSEFSI